MTVSNAADLSEDTDTCPWMPTEVQSLRKKFRHTLSPMSDLNTLSLANVGLQLALLLMKHNLCLYPMSHCPFFALGMLVSF